MAQIVANELYTGPGQRPDTEVGNYDQVFPSLTFTAASTAVSFDITNMGTGFTVYAGCLTNFPPGSASTSYILHMSAIPPIGSAMDSGALMISTGARSTAGLSRITVYPVGVSTSAGTTASFVTLPGPRQARVTISWSTAAASVNCVMSIGVSFYK